MNLLEEVRDAIEEFLLSQQMFFFNEKDLQVKLAMYLAPKYIVHLEYYVPKDELPQKGAHYPWTEKTLSIDLVIERNCEYVPVELKYKTHSLPNNCYISRFGEVVEADKIIKNQSAQDVGRYAFWKDVRRLEQLNERFEKVVGGIAVFVTNDASYTNSPRGKNVGYFKFRILKDSIIKGELFWKDANGKKVVLNNKHPRPQFRLDGLYHVEKWKSYLSQKEYGQHKMHYNMIVVKNKHKK